MDILCTRCGEPWDTYSLVDDMTPKEARLLKAGKGCPCCVGRDRCPEDNQGCDTCKDYVEATPYSRWRACLHNYFKPINQDSSYIQKELATILGDDIDGLAATMEDFNLI